METKKRTILLGLGIALVFLVFMTSGVNAQENPKAALCRQIIEAACIDRGGIAGCVFHLPGSTTDRWVVSSTSHSYGVIIYYDDNSTTLQGWSNTSDTFHGHKANYIIDRDSTAKHGGAQFAWLIDSCIFHVRFSYSSSWNTINSLESAEKEIFETAEIMYKYIEEFGLVEPPNCLTMSTVQNVKVIYPDGTEKICKEPTTIDLEEGMVFKALGSEKGKIKAMHKALEAPKSEMPIIRLPNKVLYDLEQVRIKNLKVTDGSSDMTYEARMGRNGMVWTAHDPDRYSPEDPVPTIKEFRIPWDIAFLSAVYEESILSSRTEIYTKVIVKEVIETAAIYIASTYTPWVIPAYIYDKVDTAGEEYRAIKHVCPKIELDTSLHADTPVVTYGGILTPYCEITPHSCGIIGMTNNKTEVYVFEGEFQLSDLDKTKTVMVYANQTSSCELGSTPTDPKPFDQSSVDKWWETINNSISFDDRQTENKSVSPDDSQAENWTDDGSGCWTIIDGIHTMTGTNEDIKSRYLYHNQELCDFTFEVDVRKTSGDKPGQVCTHGLYFRGDGTSENYYLFTITATGRYLISKKVEGQYTQMLGATPSDSLKTGYNEWNTLTVTARGSTTEFFINDNLVATMGDESFLCGKVGLFAIDSSTSDTPDTVQFRNIQITELEGVTPTPTPTPNPNLIPPQSGFPILP